MYKDLIVERIDEVVIIRLNRPGELNALSIEMREELKLAFADVGSDNSVGAVVLCGAGKSFCAGGNINSMGGAKPNDGRKRLKIAHDVLRQIITLNKPVVCAVQGHAVGGGLGLALACDIIVAGEDAKFCASFTKIGLVPDWGTFYTLPRLVGMAKAMEMILLAPTIDAHSALNQGLITRVVSNDILMEEAVRIATELANGPRIALGLCKTMRRSFEMSFEQALEYEALAQDLCMQTSDHLEGIRAFKERRKPAFNLK